MHYVFEIQARNALSWTGKYGLPMTTPDNEHPPAKYMPEIPTSAVSAQDLAQLARSKSVQEIIGWLEQTMLPQIKASSCVLLWGRAQPSVKFIPVFISDGYPQALQEESIQQSRLTLETYIPLFSVWKDFESPIVSRIDDVSREHKGSWHAHFQRSDFRKICASGCHDVNGHYLTYLYLTDPSAISDQEAKALLAIILPIIHSILGLVRRRKRQKQRTMAHGLLTARELEVLEWVKKGKTNPEISKILGVTFPTIKNHIQKIMIKLRVNNRAEAVGKAYGLSAQDTQLLDTQLNAAEPRHKKPHP